MKGQGVGNNYTLRSFLRGWQEPAEAILSGKSMGTDGGLYGGAIAAVKQAQKEAAYSELGCSCCITFVSGLNDLNKGKYKSDRFGEDDDAGSKGLATTTPATAQCGFSDSSNNKNGPAHHRPPTLLRLSTHVHVLTCAATCISNDPEKGNFDGTTQPAVSSANLLTGAPVPLGVSREEQTAPDTTRVPTPIPNPPTPKTNTNKLQCFFRIAGSEMISSFAYSTA